MKPKILVTGADGFIGRHLVSLLESRGYDCYCAVRRGGRNSRYLAVGEIGPGTDWSRLVRGVDVVVHLAGRAHILKEISADPRAEFMRVNAEGTAALAACAGRAGVRRFIYLSSIGVYGRTTSSSPITEDSTLSPHNYYSESKLAGERAASAAAGSMEVTVVRPPLVYGAGVKANFLRLLQLANSGWPIPLGAVNNRRSLVNVWDLCDLLARLLEHSEVAGRAWVVSDGIHLSTADLLRRIGTAMKKTVRLIPVPTRVLRTIGVAMGRGSEISSLCDSLVVDMTTTCRDLQWLPSLTIDEALERTVEWYCAEVRSGAL